MSACPVLLRPWAFKGSSASTSRRQGRGGSQQACAPWPLRDTLCQAGVLCGNLLSANGPFVTETRQEHSPGVPFAAVVVYGFSHQDPGAIPVQSCHCHEKGTDDHGIKS